MLLVLVRDCLGLINSLNDHVRKMVPNIGHELLNFKNTKLNLAGMMLS